MSFLANMPAITAAAPAMANAARPGMPPGLSKALQALGGSLQQMNQGNGQLPPMPDMPQPQGFDPLQFLQSLGPRFQPNMLGRLGQM